MQAIENPYVGTVARKLRNLKKKLEKIATYEAQRASGKALDKEQMALLETKSSLEKSVYDLASIKTQLEEVAKAESDKAANPDVTAVETNTEAVEQVDQGAQSTVADAEAEQQTTPVPENSGNVVEAVSKLLKLLHVYQRYQNATNSALPENVDFFGKLLLGWTSIKAFPDTLSSSSKVAHFYVNDEFAHNEAVRGMSYFQLSELIDELAAQMERNYNPVVGLPPRNNGMDTFFSATSAPAMHPSEPSISRPPVPHIPPQPTLPDLTNSRFDSPMKTPIEPTLQIGGFVIEAPNELFQSAPSFLIPATTSTTELYINSSPVLGAAVGEPIISLTETIAAAAAEAIAQAQAASEEEQQPVEIVMETVVIVDEAAPEGEGSEEAAPATETGADGKPKRQRRPRQRREGGAAPAATEGGDKPEFKKREFKNKRDFNRNKDATPAAEGEAAAAPATEEGNTKPFRKQRFNKNEENNGAEGAGKEKKTWVKRERKEPTAPAAESAAAPAASSTPAAAPAAPVAVAAPPKVFSYGDALKVGIKVEETPAAAATTEGEGKSGFKRDRKPYRNNNNNTGEEGEKKEAVAGTDFKPRRKFNNNNQEGGHSNNNNEAPAVDGENKGPRRPRFNNNNNNNNTNNQGPSGDKPYKPRRPNAPKGEAGAAPKAE